MKKEKICIICNKPFIAKHKNTKMCSIICKKEKIKNTSKKQYQNKTGYIKKEKICPICNKLFMPQHGKTKICSIKCKKEYQKNVNKKKYKENPEYFKKANKKRYKKNQEKCKIYAKEQYKKNPEYFKKASKKQYQEHKEDLQEYRKEYYQENKEKIDLQNKKYYQEHKPEMNKYYSNKLKTEPMYKLRQSTSRLINTSIKQNKKDWKKPKFPFNISELKIHLENQFDNKMNWDNQGSYWDIEHLIPTSWFNNEEEFFKIGWHLNNLCPLEHKANVSKGNRYAVVNNIIYYDKEEAINKFKELYLSEN